MDILRLLSRYVVAPAYSCKEKNFLFKYLRELEHLQWRSLEELQDRQSRKLKKLLIHAYENVYFYKQRFDLVKFDPYNFSSVEEFHTIPLLTKTDIINNREVLRSGNVSHSSLLSSCTGGSTGVQLHFYLDRESVNQKNACAWRHNRWADWDIGMPVAALWGNPPKIETFKAKFRSKFFNRMIYLDTMNMNKKSMEYFVHKINALDQYILYGHSHSQYLFARYLLDNQINVKSAAGIVATSMMLMKNERTIIEQVFKQKVTNRYGCEEVALIASECEQHDGLHLNINHLYIEFLKEDNQAAEPGEAGRIIVTDLTNYGAPFIRYEIGDIGVPTNRRCECGRGLPLMDQVVGRTADFLYRKDGTQVAGVSLIERFLTNIPGIHQMQIVQNAMDRLEVRIVKGSVFNKEITENKLKNEFKKVFPGSVLEIQYLGKISQTSSGKYRFAVCNINE